MLHNMGYLFAYPPLASCVYYLQLVLIVGLIFNCLYAK